MMNDLGEENSGSKEPKREAKNTFVGNLVAT